MLVSTIIPTVGRPSLSIAVKSVLDQNIAPADREIIVINDSGSPLPPADWHHFPGITIIDTNRRNRSVARNVGAAASRGKYLHFLDDDDWMMTGAYTALLKAAEASKAAWTHGAFQMVDNTGAAVTDIHPDETGNCSIQMMAWEWLPLQASLIDSKAFFAVDCFVSLSSLLGGFEDVHLSRQIAMLYDMARVDQVVASIRIGDVGSTTNYITMFDQNRQSREKTLQTHGAFTRLINSAWAHPTRSNYWFGKVIYYYLASMKWNLESKNLFTAASRGTYGLAGLVLAGSRLMTSDFRVGFLHPHYPRMGTAIQEAGADHLYANTRQAIEMASTKTKN